MTAACQRAHRRPRSPRRFVQWLRLISFAGVIALAACDNAPPDQEHMSRGIALFNAGDHIRAVLEFRNAARADAHNGEALYYLGLIYEAEEKWPEATQAYAQAVDRAPNLIDANLRFANISLLSGRLDHVIETADHVLALDPGSAEAMTLKAAALARQNNVVEAETLARDALSRDPANVSAVSVLAGIYRRQSDWQRAIAVLDEGIEKNPEDVSLRRIRIALHIEQDQRAEVEQDHRALIAIDRGNLEHRVSLARAYVAWKRPDDAEAVLVEAVTVDPADIDAQIILTDFLANQRGLDVATMQLRQYISNSPSNPRLRFTLVELYRAQEDFESAMDALGEVLELDDLVPADRRRAKGAIAQLHLIQGDLDAARQLADEILTEDSANAVALLVRSRLALLQGELDSAIANIRTMLRNDPLSGAALDLISQTYLLSGEQALASTLR